MLWKDEFGSVRRDWYIDGPYTHGEEGLACVSNGSYLNGVGVGPDYAMQCFTAEQVVGALRGMGVTDLDTDSDELQEAWNATGGSEPGPGEEMRRQVVDEVGYDEDDAEWREQQQAAYDEMYPPLPEMPQP